jgi:dihydrodipicolinate synthase/N-acetylneuraminate lyase
MVTPPFGSEVEDEHILAFFKSLASASASGLVIYNAPGLGITLSVGLIERLSDMDHIIGLKQGDLNATAIDQLSSRLGGRIRLFCASDLTFLGPLTAGFDGLSSTNSCALPEIIRTSYRAIEEGDARTATRLHQSWFAYRELARRFGQPQTVKAAMNRRGWSGGIVRAPLQSLTHRQREELGEVLDSILAAGKQDRDMPRAAHA